MKITLDEFLTQLLGARELDKFRWQAINMQGSLWEMFEFDDAGATYIERVIAFPRTPEEIALDRRRAEHLEEECGDDCQLCQEDKNGLPSM